MAIQPFTSPTTSDVVGTKRSITRQNCLHPPVKIRNQIPITEQPQQFQLSTQQIKSSFEKPEISDIQRA